MNEPDLANQARNSMDKDTSLTLLNQHHDSQTKIQTTDTPIREDKATNLRSVETIKSDSKSLVSRIKLLTKAMIKPKIQGKHEEEELSEDDKLASGSVSSDSIRYADPDEQIWRLDGYKFNEKDLTYLILKTQKRAKFRFGYCFTILMYHLVYYMLSPLFGIPLILMHTKCNNMILFNMKFYYFSSMKSTISQSVVSVLFLVGLIMMLMSLVVKIDGTSNSSVFDWLYVLNALVVKCCIIAIKYGYFSKEQMYIWRQLKLSDNLLTFHQILTKINKTSVHDHWKDIEQTMFFNHVQEGFFTIDIFKNQTKFHIKNADKLIARLQSKSDLF